ncbi:carboxylesterase/lipase family protein [Sphingopyxis sp. 113P3]|uniref:carboxylesterase/lipase family protein n=1 Tax=Sphingopyxis sp. (strain 113P3) TaxID=292913 RepID=UPI0006AD1143|nr:carboxylesterase family protein [Sphingopyxis sp. 113P3]ALC11164.1 carboxylesterase [Sphingopyxis sp. 113P3]
MIRRLLLAALLLFPAPGVAGESSIVKTTQGLLAGEILDDGSRVFRGIPYAAPPIGSARWRPPAPPPDWKGIRDATRFGPACMQPLLPVNSLYASEPRAMSEDCLTLNIWTPKAAKKAAVMLWIHGGSLLTGEGASPFFDGARLAREGVVVVTINYRLGVFGFLSHPGLTAESPEYASGNYGLLDQIAALQWVRSNIDAFGGDRENVTVFGQSAGALSIAYLLVSPLADGLFHKAIAQSPYLVPTPELQRPAYGLPSSEAIGLEVAKALGAEDIKALRAIEATRLNALPPKGGPVPQATVDGWFLRGQLPDILDAGEQAKVPLIAGFNSGEIRSIPGLAPPAPSSAEAYEDTVRARFGDLALQYLALYPGTHVTDSLLAATRDAIYGWSAQRLVATQASHGAPSYLYYFDHSYPASDARGLGAFHAIEVPYVFGAAGRDVPLPRNWPVPPIDSRERALSNAVIGYWTSFAKYGRPSVRDGPAWSPYGEAKVYMRFHGRAEAQAGLLSGPYALAEETTCRRRAAGQSWIGAVGSAPPNLPLILCGAPRR